MGEQQAAVPSIRRSFHKPVEQVNPCLSQDIERWLRIHGRPPPPNISDQQRKELEQCFKLIDTDRGGTVDAAELGSALTLLGINASKQEIAAMLEKAGADEASELDPEAFTRIMTGVLTKSDSTPGTAAAAAGASAEEDANMTSCLSFDTTATIYRRKKLMQALRERDHATLATLTEYQAEQAAAPPAAAQETA